MGIEIKKNKNPITLKLTIIIITYFKSLSLNISNRFIGGKFVKGNKGWRRREKK